MNILHTSDWHLGRSLYRRKRYEEFEAFLDWLAETLVERQIDALLIAGDLFDTGTPSNRAQQLYYRFLHRIAVSSACRHLVIIAGNHDSPTFLSAPRELLRVLDVHVVATGANPDEEILVLLDAEDRPELIVCAVPYLRERDLLSAGPAENAQDAARNLAQAIQQHYQTVADLAEQHREQLGGNLPIVGMGHLFTAGGQTQDGDGVRELYVGSLAQVVADSFPASFDYLALGHLHVPQKVRGDETRRYSGSPLPMGFGEARQQKSLVQIGFDGRTPTISLIDIPMFQALAQIRGDLPSLLAQLGELRHTRPDCWLEITYDGAEVVGDLREQLEAAVDGSPLEILRIRNERAYDQALMQADPQESLEALDIHQVFDRCLTLNGVAESQHAALRRLYREAVQAVQQADPRAE